MRRAFMFYFDDRDRKAKKFITSGMEKGRGSGERGALLFRGLCVMGDEKAACGSFYIHKESRSLM